MSLHNCEQKGRHLRPPPHLQFSALLFAEEALSWSGRLGLLSFSQTSSHCFAQRLLFDFLEWAALAGLVRVGLWIWSPQRQVCSNIWQQWQWQWTELPSLGPGKHGHAKVLLVVLDIFTDKKVAFILFFQCINLYFRWPIFKKPKFKSFPSPANSFKPRWSLFHQPGQIFLCQSWRRMTCCWWVPAGHIYICTITKDMAGRAWGQSAT